MNETWRVTEVTATPGDVQARLRPVEWFKKNPEWEAHADEVGWDGDEFIGAEPGEEGADFDELGAKSITLDISEGPDLRPGDNVRLHIEVLARTVPLYVGGERDE